VLPIIGRVIMTLFIWLIIRLIQLVFSTETVFFSHQKSANSVFQPAYNSNRRLQYPLETKVEGEKRERREDGKKSQSVSYEICFASVIESSHD
jgi:hypothetical protein